MADATQNFAEWLTARLEADATLMAMVPGGVHENIAPEGTPEPWITFTIATNRDLNAAGQIRVLTHADCDVQAIREATSYATLAPVAARIDALLHNVLGGVVISSHRVSTIRYHESTDGTQYRHLGGTYRIQIGA